MEDFDWNPVTVSGKTAVVIGGTSGIGEAISLAFAESGADVVATSRTPEKVSATAAKVRNRDADTIEVTCDVIDRASLRELRDRTVEAFGEVDVLVTSASAVSRSALTDMTEEEWSDVLDVQLTGVFRAIQVFAEEMDSGSVVNISSIAADVSTSNLPAYSAAKGGVNSLTRAAAKELAPDVRVNAIAPGFVITSQNAEEYAAGTDKRALIDKRTLLNRVADREEIAGAAVYLASDAASYTTGEVLTVDGGFADSVF